MKKIIALTSFLILLLMTVLPAGVSHAANNAPAQLTGITLVLDGGEKIKAVGGGSSFTFNLVGDYNYGQKVVKKIEITSNSASSISLLPADFDYSEMGGLTQDEYDLKFDNGIAVLDPEKLYNWAVRVNEIAGKEFPVEEIPTELFTVDMLKSVFLPLFSGLSSEFEEDENFESPYMLTGYVADQNGNESPVTLTFITEGWKAVGGKWYYYDSFGDPYTDWQVIDGKWYYFNEAGVMKTSWVNVDGKWYFFNPSGVMATGWFKQKGTWYYLDSVNGDMAAGWKNIRGKRYYFDTTTGAMETGWVKSASKWYFLDNSGVMKTGWVQSGKKWYYLKSDDGSMAVNTKIGSYKIGKDGAWIR